MAADERDDRPGPAALRTHGIAAATAVSLQLLALVELGRAGLGEFTLLAGIASTYLALHRGWFDHAALTGGRAPQVVSGVVALGVGLSTATLVVGRPLPSALLFAVTLAASTVVETGQSAFASRGELRGLIRNDVVALVGSAAAALGFVVADRVTIDALVASMLLGALVAFGDARRRPPSEQPELPSSGVEEPAAMAGAPSAAALRTAMVPASMLAVRVVVAAVSSTAGLGLLEAGRLVLTPMIGAAHWLGGFLDPAMSRATGDGARTRRLAANTALAGVAVVAAYGTAAAMLVPVARRAFDADDSFPRGLVIAWTLYAMSLVATVVVESALSARHRRGEVLRARAVTAGVGVVLAFGVVSAVGVNAVPVAMALGAVAGLGWLGWSTSAPILGTSSRPARSPRGRTAARRNWVTAVPVLLMVASGYTWRAPMPGLSRSDRGADGSLLELVVYGGVGAFLALAVAAPANRRPSTAVQFMTRSHVVGLAAIAVLGLHPEVTAAGAARWLVISGYSLAAAGRATRREMHRLVHAHVALVTVSCVIGLLWRVPPPDHLGAFTWMNVHPDVSGAMAALAVVACVAYLVRDVGRAETVLWPRGAYVIALAVCGSALVATGARGAVTGAAVGVLVVVIVSIRRCDRGPALVLGAMGALVIAGVFGPLLVDRLGHPGATAAGEVLTGDAGALVAALRAGLVISILLAVRRLWRESAEVDSALVVGLTAALLVESVVGSGIGAGGGVSAVWLLVCAAWVGVLQRRRREMERRRLVLSPLPTAAPIEQGEVEPEAAPQRLAQRGARSRTA